MTKKEFKKRISNVRGYILRRRKINHGVCQLIDMEFHWSAYLEESLAVKLFRDLFLPLFTGPLSLSPENGHYYDKYSYWLNTNGSGFSASGNREGRAMVLDLFEKIMLESGIYKELE